MEQNPPDRRSQHCCHAPPLASFSACDDQPGRPWRNSEYRVGGWICGHAQCSCLHCVEALSASIYRVSARSTCRHRSYRVGSRARGLWNLSSTKLLVSKAVRLQARHFPNHCARMHRRYCSGIRERFARNFSWPELSDVVTSVVSAGNCWRFWQSRFWPPQFRVEPRFAVGETKRAA